MHVHNVRENHHRTSNPNPAEPQKQPIVCSHTECGKSFAMPVDLKVLIRNERARYYACPYCFWPIGLEAVVLENTNIERTDNRSRAETIKPDGCEHFIGYLETRPQDAPISDECLACDSIIKCMVSKKKRKEKNVREHF